MSCYLGIDPGVSGGFGVVGSEKYVEPMPDTEKDIWDWISSRFDPEDTFAVIEKVGGFIGGNPAPG